MSLGPFSWVKGIPFSIYLAMLKAIWFPLRADAFRGACANPSKEAKLLRCIGLHAYPTGVTALRSNQQNL